MLHVSDVIDKCNSWLVDRPFDWRHVVVTAVERNNQTSGYNLFAAYLQDLNKNLKKM